MFGLFKKIGNDLNTAKDPICGMNINLEKTAFKSTYQGKEYGFCSAHCKAEFDKNPEEHADPEC